MDNLPKSIYALIPKHDYGLKRDAIAYLARNVNREDFNTIKTRLAYISNWSEITNIYGGRFTVTNEDKISQNKAVTNGDLVKIDIPILSASKSCENYFTDWIKVVNVKDEIINGMKVFSFQFIPTVEPGSKSNQLNHFYTNAASNTFILHQTDNYICLSIHGRNERPYVQVNRRSKMLRNLIIANLGLIGISNLFWSKLAHNILNFEK